MDIVFGLWADGSAAPDHGGIGQGASGAPVVGPAGLLDILETCYGLSAPTNSQIVRIAAWQAALGAANGPQRFWHRSLAVDGWATARKLLSWRDQLVTIGWRPDRTWSSSRLTDLAAAEAAAREGSDGLADRMIRVAGAVDGGVTQMIRRVRLIDRRAHQPAGWRKILDNLEANGVSIEELVAVPSARPATALGRLQRWIQEGGTPAGAPDGSVTIASSASTVLAADVLGQWFAGAPQDGATVLIAQQGDTQLLDHALQGAGQPRAGRSRRSPHRGSLQLLLLSFKTAWLPFDAPALMELLLFTRSPIAARASLCLAAALEEAPGRGGQTWRDAWTAIETAELDAAETEKDQASAGNRLERWRAWAEPHLADPVTGMPAAEAVAICDRTVAWAVARHAVDGDPLYLATATLAEDVRRALTALERPHYPRNLVERLIDQALDEGYDNPAASAEAASWRCVQHPGAVWNPVGTLVWWNFVHTDEGSARDPWTAAERGELAAQGCAPDDPALLSSAVSAAWERSILNARERVLFVTPGSDAHADQTIHPLAHRLAPALEILADKVRFEAALAQPVTLLAGQAIQRVALEPAELPLRNAVWATPLGFGGRLQASVESATSLENLLSCQLMWALKHVAKLRPGRVSSIPDANRLLGNLAHALAREIFAPGPPPAPEAAAARTEALLDTLLDEIAAPLRDPAHATDMAFARRRLPEAMAALSGTLTANDLTVEATEQQVSATFENVLAVRGAIDLVARDTAGAPVIIDLKWTRSERHRLDELRSGQAVQLATYGALLAGDQPYRAGYFLLNQRQFATLTSAGLIGRRLDGARTLPETWSAIVAAWRQWRTQGEAGAILARGVDGANDYSPPDLPITREVRCDRCDYSTICRMRGMQ
jgi:ATP-dependent helicase/nuclease subunit B